MSKFKRLETKKYKKIIITLALINLILVVQSFYAISINHNKWQFIGLLTLGYTFAWTHLLLLYFGIVHRETLVMRATVIDYYKSPIIFSIGMFVNFGFLVQGSVNIWLAFKYFFLIIIKY